jgi:hypothetical protein
MENIVADIINKTFESNGGKFQCRQDVSQAMTVSFTTRVDYEKEEGYRHLDLVLTLDATGDWFEFVPVDGLNLPESK